MDIIKNAHERTVMKEKLEEEKTKIVGEYVKKKNASARVSRGRGRGRGCVVDNPKLWILHISVNIYLLYSKFNIMTFSMLERKIYTGKCWKETNKEDFKMK